MPNPFQYKRREFWDFPSFYHSDILPKLMAMEGERKWRVRFALFVAGALFCVGIYAAWYFIVIEDEDFRALVFPFALPLVGYALCILTLRNRTKNILVKDIGGFLGWAHSRKVNAKTLVKRLRFFGFLPHYKHIIVDDVFQGEHEGWPFEFCEITLRIMKGFGERRRSETVFQGYVLSFALTRDAGSVTAIMRDPDIGHPQAPNFFTCEGRYDDGQGQVFVRSTDRVALETVMCDRFKSVIHDLETTLPSMPVGCLMDRHHLHVPIKADNKFELDMLLKSMDSSERVQKLLNEFSEVLDMLDIILRRRACLETGALDFPAFRQPPKMRT